MSVDDEQALREVTYFAGALLQHADVLPAGLTAMLRACQSDLRTSLPGRWDGIGDPVGYESAAQHIAQSVTDGQWADGQRLDDPAPTHYAWPRTPGTLHRALRLLAARGEIVARDGRYYTRARDERS